MLTGNGNIVISPKPESNAEDYEGLRRTGLSYIQQFSGSVWTDYNLHDPGITILELLCYALTDLAYRTSFPVADLLTTEGKDGPDKGDFFSARKILTSHPITINDYRKLILDRVPGVRNIWFETLNNTDYIPTIYFDKKLVTTTLSAPPAGHPFEVLQLKGLYIVKLDVEDFETIKSHNPQFLQTLAHYRDIDSMVTDPEATAAEYKTCITNFVKHLLAGARNLCEDFETIRIADPEYIAVCADIELKSNASADEVFKQVNSVLYNYINPSIPFYSIKELLEKGRRIEDIFAGPAMTRGFIDDEDLASHGHKEVLYVSDIINLLMDVKGILQIKNIHLSSYRQRADGTYTVLQNAQPYCLHLQDKENAVFQFALDAGEPDPKKIFNHIRFSKGLIYFSPKRKPEYQTYDFVDFPEMPQDFKNNLPFPKGRYRNLLNYYSVQNDFPLCYYTGMDGVPSSETTLRKAQRLQTKAYLLFFDQLLANYLSQLDNLKRVFSHRGGVDLSTLTPFVLNGKNIKDLQMLITSPFKADENKPDKEFFQAAYGHLSQVLETTGQGHVRRNLLLDHLLARFNELFVDYSVFKFQQSQQGNFVSEGSAKEVISDKIHFLQVYPIISGKRSHAFNYTKEYEANNISGLQLRLQKMMGLSASKNKRLVAVVGNPDYKTLLQNIAAKQTPAPTDQLVVQDNRFSSYDETFGVHVLEHILLKPLYKEATAPLASLLPLCGDGANNQHATCLLPDNYSLQLTVVVPGWLAISSSMDFRAFTERLIRTEAPAHAVLKICWIDPAMMYVFEETTEKLFTEMANIRKAGAKPTTTDVQRFNEALADVYAMMGLLKNIYPPSNLDECGQIDYNAETDEIHAPFILDNSALGSDGSSQWFVFEKPLEPVPDLIKPVGPIIPTEPAKPAGPVEPANPQSIAMPENIVKPESTEAPTDATKQKKQGRKKKK